MGTIHSGVQRLPEVRQRRSPGVRDDDPPVIEIGERSLRRSRGSSSPPYQDGQRGYGARRVGKTVARSVTHIVFPMVSGTPRRGGGRTVWRSVKNGEQSLSWSARG